MTNRMRSFHTNKEKVVLQSGLSVMAHIESHERKVKRIEKGVAKIVTVSAPYMHSVTCDVVIRMHQNFICHKCVNAQVLHVVDIFCTKHCGKTFNNHHNHHLHELKCTGAMSRQCGECDAKFSTVDTLNAHMKTCHPKRLEYPICENCNKALMGNRSLARYHKTCVVKLSVNCVVNFLAGNVTALIIF